jgi:hypothetical protein
METAASFEARKAPSSYPTWIRDSSEARCASAASLHRVRVLRLVESEYQVRHAVALQQALPRE